MKKYLRTSILTLKDYKTFSTDFFYGLLATPIQVLIIYLFWKNSLSNECVGGFTTLSIVKYYVFINIIQLTFSPALYVTYEVWDEINSGNILVHLLKPISYPLYIFFKKSSEFMIKFIISIGFSILVFTILNLSLSFKDIFLGIFLSIMGFVLLFEIQFLVGITTFFFGKVLTLRENIMSLCFLLGGQLLPVNILPEVIQKISSKLPMQYIYYMPAKILCGNYEINDVILTFKMDIIWFIILLVMITILFKKGLDRFEPQGG